ncbi:MAG: hypothetical protein OSB57_04110 [Planctomycetota bacterium]|nr:hypothetical protein [Planctomycetota bacterium]
MKIVLAAFLGALFASVLCSCVATSADLYELADRFEAREQGLITDQELTDALRAKGEEIERRAVATAESLPTTPMGWLALLGTMGATAAAAGAGVNKHRNNKRIKNGETV